MNITRSGILRDCLEEANREMYKYSKHGAGLLPLEGYEQHFEDLSEKCRLLRAMVVENVNREQHAALEKFAADNMEALQNPEVQARLAQWQKDLMAGKEPDMSWTGATAEKAEEVIPLEGKEYVWNPETKTWDDPPEYQGKHAKPELVVYPGGNK